MTCRYDGRCSTQRRYDGIVQAHPKGETPCLPLKVFINELTSDPKGTSDRVRSRHIMDMYVFIMLFRLRGVHGLSHEHQ